MHVWFCSVSLLSVSIDWEERLWNNLFCIEWNTEALTRSINLSRLQSHPLYQSDKCQHLPLSPASFRLRFDTDRWPEISTPSKFCSTVCPPFRQNCHVKLNAPCSSRIVIIWLIVPVLQCYCQPYVCLAWSPPSTPSIMSCYYGLSVRLVYVGKCWRGSGRICLAERSDFRAIFSRFIRRSLYRPTLFAQFRKGQYSVRCCSLCTQQTSKI